MEFRWWYYGVFAILSVSSATSAQLPSLAETFEEAGDTADQLVRDVGNQTVEAIETASETVSNATDPAKRHPCIEGTPPICRERFNETMEKERDLERAVLEAIFGPQESTCDACDASSPEQDPKKGTQKDESPEPEQEENRRDEGNGSQSKGRSDEQQDGPRDNDQQKKKESSQGGDGGGLQQDDASDKTGADGPRDENQGNDQTATENPDQADPGGGDDKRGKRAPSKPQPSAASQPLDEEKSTPAPGVLAFGALLGALAILHRRRNIWSTTPPTQASGTQHRGPSI